MEREEREAREEEVRIRLRGLVADLQAIRRRLAALHGDILPSAQELSEEDLPAELDVPTEIRSVLEGAIATGLDPLIAILTAAAEYRPASQAESERGL